MDKTLCALGKDHCLYIHHRLCFLSRHMFWTRPYVLSAKTIVFTSTTDSVSYQGICFGQDPLCSRQRPLSLHPPQTLFPNKTADFFTTDFTCSVVTVKATRIFSTKISPKDFTFINLKFTKLFRVFLT